MQKTIREVKEEHEGALMNIEGVEGIGISEVGGKECIVVYVSEKSKALDEHIPQELEGYSIRIQYTGEFQAF